MNEPLLVSLQVALPSDHRDRESGQMWRSGIFKTPVAGPVFVGKFNIDGDGQADLKNHGGADKAVMCYSADHYPEWRQRLGIDDIPYGGFGENLTIAGLDETLVCIGDTWQLGEVMLQVSQPRQPCWKLARRWNVKELAAWVIENGRGGWYVRVLGEGMIAAGMRLTLVDRPCPTWTVDRANQIMHHLQHDRTGTAELAALPLLSSAWRESLAKRLAKSDAP